MQNSTKNRFKIFADFREVFVICIQFLFGFPLLNLLKKRVKKLLTKLLTKLRTQNPKKIGFRISEVSSLKNFIVLYFYLF
jgi:hypothetical protein